MKPREGLLLLRQPKQKSQVRITLLSQVLIGQETVSLIDVNQTVEPIGGKLLLRRGGEGAGGGGGISDCPGLIFIDGCYSFSSKLDK